MNVDAEITKEKQQLLPHQPKPAEAPKRTNEITPKYLALAKRQLEIAKWCGLTIEKILVFDLLPQFPFFEGDYPAELNKSILVSEEEQITQTLNYLVLKKNSGLNTYVVEDFISKVYQLNMNEFKKLVDLCELTISSVMKLCPE